MHSEHHFWALPYLQTIAPPKFKDITHGFLLLAPDCFEDHFFDSSDLSLQSCKPLNFADRDEYFPHLLDLSMCDENTRKNIQSLWQNQLESSYPAAICAYLVSDHSLDNLVSLFRRQMIIDQYRGTPPIKQGRALWRFYDPNVFALLPLFFSASEIKTIAPIIQEWHFPWGNISACFAFDKILLKPESSFVMPSAAQYLALQQVATIHRLLKQLNLTKNISAKQRLLLARRIEYGMNKAVTALAWNPVFQAHDIALYAEYTARGGELFTSLPELAPLTEKVRDQKLTFLQALDALGAEQTQILKTLYLQQILAFN